MQISLCTKQMLRQGQTRFLESGQKKSRSSWSKSSVKRPKKMFSNLWLSLRPPNFKTKTFGISLSFCFHSQMASLSLNFGFLASAHMQEQLFVESLISTEADTIITINKTLVICKNFILYDETEQNTNFDKLPSSKWLICKTLKLFTFYKLLKFG